MRRGKIQKALKAGHFRPASKTQMAFCWQTNDGPTLNAGLVALGFSGYGPVLLRDPMFCEVSGGGGPDPPFSGSEHVLIQIFNWQYVKS